MEYYYIDFKNLDICSWEDEDTDLDRANRLTGNFFLTYYNANYAVQEIINKQKIS